MRTSWISFGGTSYLLKTHLKFPVVIILSAQSYLFTYQYNQNKFNVSSKSDQTRYS